MRFSLLKKFGEMDAVEREWNVTNYLFYLVLLYPSYRYTKIHFTHFSSVLAPFLLFTVRFTV